MRRKRVIFIIESFILGGAEKVLVDIVNHLDPDKLDVTVCSIFKKSVYKNYEAMLDTPFSSRVHYKWLINNDIVVLYRLFNLLLTRIPALLYSFFVGDKYDAVVAFYEGTPTAFVANACLKRGKKVTWLHTSTDLSQKGKTDEAISMQEKYYTSYSEIIAVSEGVKNSFISLFPSLKDRVIVIHNPVDSDTILKNSSKLIEVQRPDCPLLVSVGRMTPAKGYDRYLRVVRQLIKAGQVFEVWIIGGGDRTQYENYCKENRLSNVKFLGNQVNPYPFMKIADWIVVPSMIEGLGMVTLESLCLHKAIIMTKCAATKELLGDSQFGLVVENNEEALYSGLLKILNSSTLKQRYEDKARKRISDFDRYQIYKTIEGVLSNA